jgi:hypothetical protein
VNRPPSATGPRILAALLVAAAVAHAVLVWRVWAVSPIPAVLDGVLAVAALVLAALALRRPEPPVLLGAAVVGAIGVATYLLPSLVATFSGRAAPGLLDPWAFGALLVDALVVRIAVFTLRRSQAAGTTGG